jgi:hypothetical protein
MLDPHTVNAEQCVVAVIPGRASVRTTNDPSQPFVVPGAPGVRHLRYEVGGQPAG